MESVNSPYSSNSFGYAYSDPKAINYFIGSSSLKEDGMKILTTPVTTAFNEYIEANCLINDFEPDLGVCRKKKSIAKKALLLLLNSEFDMGAQSLNDVPADFCFPSSWTVFQDTVPAISKAKEHYASQGKGPQQVSNIGSQLKKFFEYYFMNYAPKKMNPINGARLAESLGTAVFVGKNLNRRSKFNQDVSVFGLRLSKIMEEANHGVFVLHQKLTEHGLEVGNISAIDLSNWTKQKTLPSRSKMPSIRKLEDSILKYLAILQLPLAKSLPANFLSSVAINTSTSVDEVMGSTKDEQGVIRPRKVFKKQGRRRASNLNPTRNDPIWHEMRKIVELRKSQSMRRDEGLKPVKLKATGEVSSNGGGKFDGVLLFEVDEQLKYHPGQGTYVQGFASLINQARAYRILEPGEESLSLLYSIKFLDALVSINDDEDRSTAFKNYETARRWIFQKERGDALPFAETIHSVPKRFQDEEYTTDYRKWVAERDKKLNKYLAKFTTATGKTHKKDTIRLYLAQFPDFPRNPDIKPIYDPFIARVHELYAARKRYIKNSISYHYQVRKATVLAILISQPMRVNSIEQALYFKGPGQDNSFFKVNDVYKFKNINTKVAKTKATGFVLPIFTYILDEYVNFSREYFLPPNDPFCDYLFPGNRQNCPSNLKDMLTNSLKNIKGIDFTGHTLRVLCGTVCVKLNNLSMASQQLGDRPDMVLEAYSDELPDNVSSQWLSMVTLTKV